MAKAKFQLNEIIKVKELERVPDKYRNVVSRIYNIRRSYLFFGGPNEYFIKGKDFNSKALFESEVEETTDREKFLYHLYGPGIY